MVIHEVPYEKEVHENAVPVITVILPICYAVYSLRETIDSILKQNFDAWELLIVCGQGVTKDDAATAVRYVESDKRIRVIEDSQLPGIAESLNTGIEQARGKYIALIAGGDVSDAGRLSAQFAYMEEKQNVGATQFYQRCCGNGEDDFIYRPPESAEAMKAKLLFFCDVCFSAVMIRKSVLEEHQIMFDPEAHFPEHVFWFRMVQVTDFETIPKVYGASRIGSDPFPVRDDAAAHTEMSEMAAKLIAEKLELQIPPEMWYLLGGRKNDISDMVKGEKGKTLVALSDIMFEIWKENLIPRYFNSPKLTAAIAAKWRWARYDTPWQGEPKINNIGVALEFPKSMVEESPLKSYLVRKFSPKVQAYRRRREMEKTQHLADMLHNVSNE